MKTDRPHDEIEELIVADTLDGLEPADRERLFRKMADHGPDCPDCARLLAEYGEVAGWLALALEPTPLSEGAEDRLLQAALAERQPVASAVGRWRRWVAAASVAAALAVVAGAVGWTIAPRGQGDQSEFLAFVARPGVRVATLASATGRTLAVAFRSGGTEAWVVGTSVPDPVGNHVYELWYRPAVGAKMQPAGTFVPLDGTVVSKVKVGGSFDTLAVSVEPPGGSAQPTTTPIYLASV
jgi:Anti-sigma-K factor rskA, C-terminal